MKKDESDTAAPSAEEEGKSGREVIVKKMSYQFKLNIRSDCSSACGNKLRRRMRPRWSEALLLQAREGCIYSNSWDQAGFRSQTKSRSVRWRSSRGLPWGRVQVSYTYTDRQSVCAGHFTKGVPQVIHFSGNPLSLNLPYTFSTESGLLHFPELLPEKLCKIFFVANADKINIKLHLE